MKCQSHLEAIEVNELLVHMEIEKLVQKSVSLFSFFILKGVVLKEK